GRGAATGAGRPARPVLTTREGFRGNAGIRMDRTIAQKETRAARGIFRLTVEVFRFFNQFRCFCQ
ncbi:hypothetical protein, partial [Azospirillum sp. Sp 7]|uniref:hypothetical protein n=1 Tax=Azospirillum sp. Sp 7 TaxID=1685931 RepID=UPI001B3BBD5D